MDRLRRKMFLAVLYSCFILCGATDEQKRFDGEILPKYLNVCTTQSITFTGVLNDDPVTNYSIGFTYKTRDTNGKYVTVDQNNVTYINDTMAEYTVPYIPPLTDLDRKSYMFVYSYYWQVFGDNSTTLQLGETSLARIFPMPEEVRDFDCIVSNYETMICSWSYGTDYGSFMPEVIFQWRNPVYSKTWTECKYLNIQDGYCTWNETKAGYFKTSNITIRLTLKQRCNFNVTSVFHIDTSKIVKPNPVSSIRSNVINSTCISLLWETTKSEQFYPKEHLITLSSLGGPVTNNTLITTRDTEKLEHEQTFCDMHPYTNYSFNVRIRPTGLFSGYFSDTVEHTSTTYSDIPSASPQVIKGGYRLDHRECEDGIERRRVCMFWKPIKFEDRNGPMKGLVGEFTALPPAIHKVKENWTKDEMYGCSTILCNTGYIFTIKARNINGTSKQGSSVSIPAKGTTQPQFIVESTNSSDVFISWTYTGNDTPRSFLVAWCRNENGDCRPGHEIGWRAVTGNSTNTTIFLDTPQDYVYGVGALTETDGSSGVEWQDCVYLKHSVPKRRPKNVVVSTGSEDYSLVVTWEKRSCASNEPYIAMYNIQYYNGEQRRSLDMSESEKARLVLKNLNEDQTYFVTVRAVTKNGIYGPESLPQTGVPRNKSLKSSEIVGITLGVLVCVTFAFIGLFCAVRRCKKKAQEAIKQAGNITIPECPELEKNTSLTRQNSRDSGYEKTPPLDKKMKGSNIIINLPYDYRCATAFTNVTQDTTASHCVLSGTPDKSMIVSEMSKDDVTSIGDYPLQLNTLKCTSAESMYSCKQDNCVGGLSKKENTDLVECAKQLSNCIDTNHDNISILPTKYVHLENNIEAVPHNDDTQLFPMTDKSNPYITPTNQYLSSVPLHSFSTDIFKQDHGQEQQTDTCNFPDQSQKLGIIRSINASSYVPFDTTSFIPSQPDTDNAGSKDTEIPESSDSIVSPKLDIDLTFLSAFGNAPGMNPESPSFSTMTESVKNATSTDDAYSSQIPVEFDQRKDSCTVADLDTIDDHSQLQYCIKYASDEEQNLNSVPSSDEETPFCSHAQKPKSNFTSDYVPHSVSNIVQKKCHSRDPLRENSQDANSYTTKHAKYKDDMELSNYSHYVTGQESSIPLTSTHTQRSA